MVVTKAEYTKALNYAKCRMQKQDAEEMVQEALIKAWKRDNVKYLKAFVRDSYYAYITEPNRQKKRIKPLFGIKNPGDTVEDLYNAHEQRQHVIEFLCSNEGMRLPAAQRYTLTATALNEETSQTALVQHFNLSKPLACYHYHKAFEQLTAYLKAKGVIP